MRSAIAMAAVLLIVPSLAAAGEADAGGEAWKHRVQDKLAFVELTFEGKGWTLDREIRTGSLGDGRIGHLPFHLSTDTDYAIVAACEEACGDIDLFLYDRDDALIDSDAAEAGLPLVRVAPVERGRYDLEVRMFDCVQDECDYGVAVFSRPAGIRLGAR